MNCETSEGQMCELQAEKATLPKTFNHVYYIGLVVIVLGALAFLFMSENIRFTETKHLIIGLLILFTLLALWKIMMDLIIVIRKVNRFSKENN